MPTKRTSDGQFISGVRAVPDVNPQLIRGSVQMSAANAFTEAVISTPVIAEAGYVMELLKIFLDENLGGLANLNTFEAAIYDRSRAAIPNISDPGVIHSHRRYSRTGGATASSYTEVDLTDGGGNGLLYGKKQIFCAADSTDDTVALGFKYAILYRLKAVNATELVGLMQD